MRAGIIALLLAAGAVAPARAQGSAFALHGLGWPGRPMSARSAATGGALAMVDPQMSANPAALARWRAVAGWAVAAPTRRNFAGPAGPAELQTVRFPLFGFVAMLPQRAAVGLSISDYLDRTWTIEERDSLVLRGQTETFTDAGRSIGGVSDLALQGAWRNRRESLALGFAFHYYLGSARLTAQRQWDSRFYEAVLVQSQTDFRGWGVGAGLNWNPGRRVDVALSGRLNNRLLSRNSAGHSVYTPLPHEANLGLRLELVPGVFLAGTTQYATWSRANDALVSSGEEPPRDTWSAAVGAEVQRVSLGRVRTPLRLGYRRRQLPFPQGGVAPDEWAFSGGFGMSFARDRTAIDIGFERGSREAGSAREDFTSVFIGLTVRP